MGESEVDNDKEYGAHEISNKRDGENWNEGRR